MSVGQIDRCLDLLVLLSEKPEGLPLSEVATRLDIPKSAAHRLLAKLVERGFARQDPVSSRYLLTLKLAVIGLRHLAASGLKEVCQPELEALAARTGELVRLAVVENETLTWVCEVQGARYGLRYEGDYRRGVRLHATATGKAWLATLDEEDAVRLVLQQGFAAPDEMGPRAIRTVEGLLIELRRTRERGFAIAYEEGEPGMAAVAAAIPALGPEGPAVGTVSVAGPIVRLTRQRLLELGPVVVASARALGEIWPARLFNPLSRRQAAAHGAAR